MKIFFDKLYKDDRKQELCGLCVPFSKGELPEDAAGTLSVMDGDRTMPTEVQVTSKWEDGSVRYAFVRFLADLPGNAGKELELTRSGNMGKELVQAAPGSGAMSDAQANNTAAPAIRITPDEDTLIINNGSLTFRLQPGSGSLFDGMIFEGRTFDSSQFVGPIVTLNGQQLRTVFDSWEVVQEGRLFSVFEGKGRCMPVSAESTNRQSTIKDDGSAPADAALRFEIRLSVTAGKPWLEMGYRIFNCTDRDITPDSIVFTIKSDPKATPDTESPAYDPDTIPYNGWKESLETSADGTYNIVVGTANLKNFDVEDKGKAPAMSIQSASSTHTCDTTSNIRSIVARSNYKTRFSISMDGKKVEDTITAEMLEKEANEHFAEVFYGTFFADYTDMEKDLGVCATVFQAYQNFPKAVAADSDGIRVFLLPDQDKNASTTKASKVTLTSGMAREQKMLLHFHSAGEPIEELDNRSLIYQMPDKPYIDPKEFSKAGVMPEVFLDPEDQDDEVEIALIEKADSHVRCYGMLNFGDGPDPGYTAQGRGDGGLVWTNNEYDYPHAMYMMYARIGIRRFLDYANTAASHWMDVDVCHYSKDPLQRGGQWEHTRRHTGGSEEGRGCKGDIVCSHQWVEGLLDYYHFTGDERGLKTAIGIGENVLRLLELPQYQQPGEAGARETGWALRTLTALYIETGDIKWTEKCRWIVGQFEQWNDRYGNWLQSYTDNTMIRTGFMISIAIGSLMRYYRVFPDENLKDLILGAVDDLTENYMTRQGLFIYKELPSLSRNGTNTLLLEAMTIGYELTGDRKYLDLGKRTFDRAINASPVKAGGKKIVEDAVIVGSGAPKNFAQSFFPISGFYVKMKRANKLLKQD